MFMTYLALLCRSRRRHLPPTYAPLLRIESNTFIPRRDGLLGVFDCFGGFPFNNGDEVEGARRLVCAKTEFLTKPGSVLKNP